MNESHWTDESIRACPIYEPGLPIETVARDLGMDPESIVKLASNENPLGPSPRAVEAVARGLGRLHDYPDGGTWALRERLARELGLEADRILPANGSNEVLEMIGTAYLAPGLNAVMGEYGFVVYRLATLHAKAVARVAPMPDLVHDLDAFRERIDDETRVVFLARPNNPTGDSVDAAKLLDFVRGLPPQVLFCFDEAYVEYLENPVDLRPLMEEGRRIVCVRTFSKIHGLAGLRVGYAYGPAEIIATLHRVRQPFNVGTAAQLGAAAALDDREHQERTRRLNKESLDYLVPAMEKLGVPVRRGEANFILLTVPSARRCFEALLRRGVIVRPLDGYGLPDRIRVSTGTAEGNERFVAAFTDWWREEAG